MAFALLCPCFPARCPPITSSLVFAESSSLDEAVGHFDGSPAVPTACGHCARLPHPPRHHSEGPADVASVVRAEQFNSQNGCYTSCRSYLCSGQGGNSRRSVWTRVRTRAISHQDHCPSTGRCGGRLWAASGAPERITVTTRIGNEGKPDAGRPGQKTVDTCTRYRVQNYPPFRKPAQVIRHPRIDQHNKG